MPVQVTRTRLQESQKLCVSGREEAETLASNGAAERATTCAIEVMPRSRGDTRARTPAGPVHAEFSLLRSRLAKRWAMEETSERTAVRRATSASRRPDSDRFITPLTHNFCESCNGCG